MARITVPGFSGVVRIIAPQRLEDHQAQVAEDADFRSGDLRPYYGDKASTTFGGTMPTNWTDPTLFLHSTGKLIAAGAELSFARSPVFFSDSQANDTRVFYAAQEGDSGYPLAIKAVAASGLINLTSLLTIEGNVKRLGVPQPAPLVGEPKTAEQSGTVTSVAIYSQRNGQQDRDDQITTATPHHLKDLNKVIIDHPGISPAARSIDVDNNSSVIFRLQATARKYKACDVKLTKDGGASLVNAVGHGLSEGDQILIDYQGANPYSGGTGATASTFSRGRIWQVKSVTAGAVELDLLVTSTLEIDAWAWKPANVNPVPRAAAFFVVARADYPLTQVSIGEPSRPKPNSQYADYTLTTTSGGTWVNAATADTVRDRAYCVTFVNEFGDESEPSLPTNPKSVVPGNDVTLTIAPYASKGQSHHVQYFPISKVRIYRTDEIGTFRLVTTEEDAANTLTWKAENMTFTDTKTDAELGEPLTTTGWSVPPIGLKGLVNAPNGMVAGFKGRTVAGAVPYAPYAWPLANQVATDYEVVGLVPTSAGMVVVTKGMPAILIGDNPANWTMQKLEYAQGCVSRRSIVDMGEFAMYASPDGLVAITGAAVEVLTKPIMTREQWQAYNPTTIVAGQVEGRYIATYLSGNTRKGFIYDPQTQSFTDLTLTAQSFANDLLNDVLLMLGTDGKVTEWNQATASFKPYVWVSRWFQLPVPEIMGVAQIFTTTIDLTGRTLTFRLHGYDNNQATLIYEISTTSNPNAILGNRPFRLPYVAPGRFTAFKVTLEGSIPVGTVMVGRTMDELKEAP
jgi:hypothetical protein